MQANDPFKTRPRAIARLPRLIRFYIFHCLIGFGAAGVFTGLVLWLNVANIGHLVTHVAGGWLAAFVFFLLNGIVFAGVQSGIAFWSLGVDDATEPPGGTPAASDLPALARVPTVRSYP